jgi:hypothetical protein
MMHPRLHWFKLFQSFNRFAPLIPRPVPDVPPLRYVPAVQIVLTKTKRMKFYTSGILEKRNRHWRYGLAVCSGPLEFGGELDVFGLGNADVEIIRGRAELTESKLLTLGPAGMDTILRHIHEIVSYVTL